MGNETRSPACCAWKDCHIHLNLLRWVSRWGKWPFGGMGLFIFHFLCFDDVLISWKITLVDWIQRVASNARSRPSARLSSPSRFVTISPHVRSVLANWSPCSQVRASIGPPFMPCTFHPCCGLFSTAQTCQVLAKPSQGPTCLLQEAFLTAPPRGPSAFMKLSTLTDSFIVSGFCIAPQNMDLVDLKNIISHY